MKILLQATVTFQWEEDSENWPDDNIASEANLITVVQEYYNGDRSYVLDCEPVTFSNVEKVKS